MLAMILSFTVSLFSFLFDSSQVDDRVDGARGQELTNSVAPTNEGRTDAGEPRIPGRYPGL
jgi:hypothetical protein